MKTKLFIVFSLFLMVKLPMVIAQEELPVDSLELPREKADELQIKIDTSSQEQVQKQVQVQDSSSSIKPELDGELVNEIDSLPLDSNQINGIRKLAVDTIPRKDSLAMRDTLSDFIRNRMSQSPGATRPVPSSEPLTVSFADSGLDAEIDYSAEDSMRYDFKEERIYLYGNAVVKYTTMTLEADFIIYEWTANVATAEELPDSLGRKGGRPRFKDGNQDFQADRLRFNFKTKKGIVYDVRTQQGNDYIHSGKAKFITNDADTTESEEVFYGSNALFTTCNHPHPHFGIRSKKQKIIPEKFVIAGPSNLEISGIPTPIWLPFGVFPLNKQKSTGLIFGDWEISEQLGPGLRRTGWYFPLGDQMNLQLTGDFYTRGTFRVYADMSYRKRYKYNGTISLSYTNDRVETPTGFFENSPGYGIRISHNQDPKAHPFNKFTASVDAQTRNFNQRTFNSAEQVLQTTYNSRINYTRNFPNKPIFFSAAISHSQDTRSRIFRVNLPTVDFRLNQIFPFKHKIKKAKERWYEKITFNYDVQAKNEFITTDTSIFTQQTLDDAKFGVRHRASTGANFPIFKFFTINPRANYTEVWDFKHLNRFFENELLLDSLFEVRGEDSLFIGFDTLGFGNEVIDTIRGFKPWRTYDFAVSLNTSIYGTKIFRKGFIRGFRHTIRPNVSFNYRPSFTDRDLGYYRDYIRLDNNGDPDTSEYSIFQGGVYGSPPSGQQQMSIGYGMTHLFEAKYYSKKDSTIKKLRLADVISINGSYNFVADSLNWSKVSFSTGAKFIKNLVTLRLSMTMDPYALQEDEFGIKRRVNKFYWNTNRRLLRFEQAELRLSTGFTIDRFTKLISGDESQSSSRSSRSRDSDDGPPTRRRGNEPKAPESLFDYFKNFRISYNFTLRKENTISQDTTFISVHNIRVSGNMQLSEKWAVTLGNIAYDFKRKEIVFPDLGFARDLHCWTMSINWRPTRNTYTFNIRVKPGTLGFLNVPYRKNQFDGF